MVLVKGGFCANNVVPAKSKRKSEKIFLLTVLSKDLFEFVNALHFIKKVFVFKRVLDVRPEAVRIAKLRIFSNFDTLFFISGADVFSL